MNLKELKELIELLSEKDFTEFEIERQGFRMRISRSRGEAPPAVAPVIVPSALPIPFGTSSAQEASRPEIAAASKTAAAAPPATATTEDAAPPEPALRTIKSPMPGTFYRSPSPTSDPFVKIGDHVEPETVVCIVEAMKLMNPIQAETTGEIVKIYVENGQPVEYGQPLFGIKT